MGNTRVSPQQRASMGEFKLFLLLKVHIVKGWSLIANKPLPEPKTADSNDGYASLSFRVLTQSNKRSMGFLKAIYRVIHVSPKFDQHIAFSIALLYAVSTSHALIILDSTAVIDLRSINIFQIFFIEIQIR